MKNSSVKISLYDLKTLYSHLEIAIFMKLGVIKEVKVPPDKRVPFNPEQCSLIEDRFPNADLMVQKSEVRAFTDEEYEVEGLPLVNDLQEADTIFGVKEVQIEDLIANKTFFFFSHTINLISNIFFHFRIFLV